MMKSASYDRLSLDSKACRVLADALGDTPETVISVHLLRRGLCRAYVAGDPACFEGAIVQDNLCPAEPMGFGEDAEVLWELLKGVRGWACVNVTPACAIPLGRIIEREMEARVRYYGDLYYTLSRPVSGFHNEAVRQLTLADLKLLESAPTEVRGNGFGSPRTLLMEGVVAAAVVSGRIVSIAQQKHANAADDWQPDQYAKNILHYAHSNQARINVMPMNMANA